MGGLYSPDIQSEVIEWAKTSTVGTSIDAYKRKTSESFKMKSTAANPTGD